MEQLIDYIENFVKLDSEAINALKELSEFESYKKNQHILEVGQRCRKIWFIKSGMVRKYHILHGKEVTSWMHTENDTFTSFQSYAQQLPSKEYIQASEDCKTICISRNNSEKLIHFPAIASFTNALMEREIVNIDIHTKALNSKSAKERYEYLQEIAPELIKRAKLGYIASIIGVSQETLSRIRRKWVFFDLDQKKTLTESIPLLAYRLLCKMIESNFSGQLKKMILMAKSGSASDTDYIMSKLTGESDFAATRYVDFALSLVSNPEGFERIKYYLFHGTQIQRNYASLYLNRLGEWECVKEAYEKELIDEIQAFAR